MNPNLTHGIDTGKVLNVKHILTTLAVTIIILFILQKVIKQNIVIYDKAGAETGRGEINFSLGMKKKA
jgi:hypothetical protein